MQKELDKIPFQYQRRILVALSIIAGDPLVGKKLIGELSSIYSYRFWPYKIIYKVYRTILLIVIIRISHRQGVYKQ
ncbi:MAG: type II toxin-antitoxin system RelE/ParE family toxin [bacterium]